MKKIACSLVFVVATLHGQQKPVPAAKHVVTVTTGNFTMPTYEHPGRELQPPLFANSAVTGIYPFPTFKMPLKSPPVPKIYKAIFVENEYLKLTYVPEFGGRFLELYDKLRKRNVFYKNDVLKSTQFNPRGNWPQEGIELTGPYDAHSLTTHFDPFWSNVILHNPDGSITIRLGETDPIYGMTVRYSATLHPGVAAMEISTFCFNPNTSRMPQMFWSNASFPTTQETQFIYPMTRTVGHNTGQVTDWPMYEGVDYSWDRNNKNMLGVFGIDMFDNFGGAYMFDQDYGVFRYADRRVVQGMKMWTFGHGRDAASMEASYTDKAGPYYEAQSGRHVWDGHYEWVAPHQVEEWHEWWIPVGGTQGLSTLTREVALNLQVKASGSGSSIQLDLSPVTAHANATLEVRSTSGKLLKETISLQPGQVIHKKLESAGAPDALRDVEVIVTAGGKQILSYRRPNTGEKRSEYTAFTRELEKPSKSPDVMSAEELALAAESHLKDLDDKAGLDLLDLSLKRDAGYSVAHTLKGIVLYKEGKLKEAELDLQQAVDRDPYADTAWYYLAITQLELGKKDVAERELYYIWPNSAFYGNREYQLGRLEFLREDYAASIQHLQGALNSNGKDLSAYQLLSMAYRLSGDTRSAESSIAAMLRIDPSSRAAYAERFLLSRNPAARAELKRLMGDQSQEALHVAAFFTDVDRWRDAVTVLQLVENGNKDPWGTSAVFYYTLAYNQKRAGDGDAAAASLQKAKSTAAIVDRFPYLKSSEPVLRWAVETNPGDTLARFDLGCLLYSLGKTDDAVTQWQAAEKIHPESFGLQRALGLAYAERGDTKDGVAHLEKAVALDESHLGTVNDLVTLYAQAGRFDDELKLLRDALKHTEDKDDLMLRLLHVELVQGQYQDAEALVRTHTFSPRHRDYTLRDEYRALKYAEGARAFSAGKYSDALVLLREMDTPPANLGVDDFQFQSSARQQYALARTLEALGRKDEARKAYEESVRVVDLTAGDRASYNSDNVYMLLSLKKLGREAEVKSLSEKFESFAESQLTLKRVHRRAEGKYLQGQIALLRGDQKAAKEFMNESLEIEPDFLMPRFDLRGDGIGTAINVSH